MNALSRIQSELKAPKNQENKFGGYRYRSCEDILEAVKPLLAKYHATLVLSDAIEEVGGRVYVKATATFKAVDASDNNGITFTTSAYAREPESRKGMDESQITGAASSYARKYALNGLFCIDDTKDADATNKHAVEFVTASQLETLETLAAEVKANIKNFCAFLKVSSLSELPSSRYDFAIKALEKKRSAA